ncbi:thymidine phosphorylase [Alkalibacter mobilis]|uniref:thymidine phosphorylase n=1 Tax=Alkalibacter mobilis TaxID=2787712 RepID=UPI00189DEC6C|nr:thymidine phosphorylase [Alkalibacter mobilis]MBF7096869.1 thymidine phosphorylase [Alkalibacter mobilis]
MRIYDIIIKKREGDELTDSEIEYFVNGFTNDQIPDYQISALLMCIYFNGLNMRETVSLTKAMMNSGEIMDLSAIKGIITDKHSTGGVGDTTTIILAPLLASCGVPVAKMSGRGLGHTGGTIDKMESIEGFKTNLSKDEFVENVNKYKIALAGQTGKIAPADKKIYALRDVTATVDQVSLIASSIMSKKLAAGSDAILLDVKFGSGAFMKTQEEAFELAKIMVDIGNDMGRHTKALITNMDEPLGSSVGNALEVREAIRVLRGESGGALLSLSIHLAAEMMIMAKEAEDTKSAMKRLTESIDTRKAYDKFVEFVFAQGGNTDMIKNPELLPVGKYKYEVRSSIEGHVNKIDASMIGQAALIVGAGRENKESKIDPGVGLILHKRVGDHVDKDEILAEIYFNDKSRLDDAVKKVFDAIKISNAKISAGKLILGQVSKDGIERF